MDLARRVALIRDDSRALGAAARGNLAAPVAACPEWDVRELVRHILQVQRSWCRIVAERIMEPDWADEPFPDGDALVDAFLEGAERFAGVLAATDPSSPCWTWGRDQNAGFVQRFQVQETALHRWDAQAARGAPEPIAADGAADSLEMLTELMTDLLPHQRSEGSTPVPTVCVEATDLALSLEMFPRSDTAPAGTLRGTASDLLLVLWRRRGLAHVGVDGDADAIRLALEAVNLD